MLSKEVKAIPKLISVPSHSSATGTLYVYQYSDEEFKIGRVFVVSARAGAERGQHAHRKCTQILVCLTGAVNVKVDDGRGCIYNFNLTEGSDSILIPPGLWASQKYTQDDAKLMVLCDLPFDEEDYVRDYEEFLRWRALSQT